MKNKIQINSFVLHIIAILTMIINHICIAYNYNNLFLDILGRLSFPIFLFLIVEGFKHTSNIYKYILRIFIFALISEIPFDLLFYGKIFYFSYQNVLWSFLIVLIMLLLLSKTKSIKDNFLKIIINSLIIISSYIISFVIQSDGMQFAVLLSLLFYYFDKHYLLIFVVMLLTSYVFAVNINYNIFGYNISIPVQCFSSLSIILLYLYNGNHGYNNKIIKYIFYLIYPVHLLILYILTNL